MDDIFAYEYNSSVWVYSPNSGNDDFWMLQIENTHYDDVVNSLYHVDGSGSESLYIDMIA